MNFQPLITRKELAAKVGISVDTLNRKYESALQPAKSRATEKPVTYFAGKAFRILLKAGALASDD